MQTPTPYGLSTIPSHRGGVTLYSVREPPSDYLLESEELETVRRLVRRPLSERTPCTYRRRFLDAYHPNVTRYLPATTVTHLHLMGTTLYHRHPPGAYARALFSRLAIDLGRTAARFDGPSDNAPQTTRTLINHALALSWLLNPAHELQIDSAELQSLYVILNTGLSHPWVPKARLRQRPVTIANSVYTPTAIAPLIEELFATVVAKARAIEDPFEQAFFLMAQLVYLQPWIESHPRTSRLAANIGLMRHNLVPLVFLGISEESYRESLIALYEHASIELLRDNFVQAYERSCGRLRGSEGHNRLI